MRLYKGVTLYICINFVFININNNSIIFYIFQNNYISKFNFSQYDLFKFKIRHKRMLLMIPPDPLDSSCSVPNEGSSGMLLLAGTDGANPGPRSALYMRSSAMPGKSGR